MDRFALVIGLVVAGGCGDGEWIDGLPEQPPLDDAGLAYGEEHESISWKCSCTDSVQVLNSPTGRRTVVQEFEPTDVCIGRQDQAQRLAKRACEDAHPDATCGCACCATPYQCVTTALDECFTGEIGICPMFIADGSYRCSPSDLAR